jgi:hypothetical protein
MYLILVTAYCNLTLVLIYCNENRKVFGIRTVLILSFLSRKTNMDENELQSVVDEVLKEIERKLAEQQPGSPPVEQKFTAPGDPTNMEQLMAKHTVDMCLDQVGVGQYFTPDLLPRLVAESLQTVHRRYPKVSIGEKKLLAQEVVKESLKYYRLTPADMALIQKVIASMIQAMCQVLLDINAGKYDFEILQIRSLLKRLWDALKVKCG